ncbi:MAG: Na+/H+ antiporter NhaC family protein [Planctomycetota bacterium]
MLDPRIRNITIGAVVLGFLIALAAGIWADPKWSVNTVALQVETNDDGDLYYTVDEEPVLIGETEKLAELPNLPPEEVSGRIFVDPQDNYFIGNATKTMGFWSFVPPIMAIILCLTLKDPLIALLMGVISGGLLLQQYNIIDDVLLPSFASSRGAGILLLYLWLLGALMGIWSRTGAAEAFAQWATEKFVRGPKSAKFVAWILGVLFFQGGSISTVIVGATVKPVADKEKISHEELSYIVDSTASPIAILLAFNAWPIYIQALLFVPGVAYLATDEARMSFFFDNLYLSFYAIFAVLGTFLLAIDRAPIVGKKMRAAIKRSRETGQLDRPGAEPMVSQELQTSSVPEGYKPSVFEFLMPLGVLTAIAVGSYWFLGTPEVRVAFAVAVMAAALSALINGMQLKHLMEGIGNGLKGVVVASVILMLAVTLGRITGETGAAAFLVDLLGSAIPFWLLPGLLFVLTIAIAFATGSSWGTYAVAFSLAMPLAFSIAAADGLANPDRFVAICFAAVLNGSVMGDQCSPVSDTTVLSSMTTGADLMDHVLTQLTPASVAGSLALICWTALTFTCS